MLTKEIVEKYGFERFSKTIGFPWNEGETEVYMKWGSGIGVDLLNKKAFKATWNAPDAFPYPRESKIETFYYFPETEEQLFGLWFAITGKKLNQEK